MRYLAWFTLGLRGICTVWDYLRLWSVANAMGL